ncbi:MAG: hypothetical protein R3247_06665 [Rhodothermales bacterium]|nr:hypothetical protein [Rhodothermales bacterium]
MTPNAYIAIEAPGEAAQDAAGVPEEAAPVALYYGPADLQRAPARTVAARDTDEELDYDAAVVLPVRGLVQALGGRALLGLTVRSVTTDEEGEIVEVHADVDRLRIRFRR